MAGRIKGITVEIGGDTTKLQTALKGVNSQIRSTESQLKDVNKLLKLDPGNTDLLAQKQRMLADAITNTKSKLETLKTAQEQASQALKDGTISQEQYDGLQREIEETTQKLKALEDQANQSGTAVQQIATKGEKLKDIGGKVEGVGKAVMPASAATAAIGVAAVKTAADFDSGMSKVSAVSGATGDDLEALRAKAREMGEKTKFSASEAADAMNYMAMAGWKTDDMLNGIDGVMNLAAASGEDLATTSDIVTDALTAFGLKASDSGHFADILAAASSNANTNVSMMGETFKYAAPVAGALGFSAEDTAEAIGLMANAGIKSTQAGTSLRSIMDAMTGPIDLVGKNLGEVTIQTTNADGTMRSLSDILSDCRGAFAQMTESEQANAAESLVGKNAMSGFLALMNAAPEDVDKLSGAIANCDGTSEKMATTMQDNLAGQLTILKSQLEELAISFGEMMMPVIRNIVSAVQDFVDKLNSLPEPVKEIILKVGLFVAAAGPVLIMIGKISQGIGSVMTLVPKIAGAISTVKTGLSALHGVMLANPIGIIITAIAALVAAFIYLWNTNEDFRNFWINLWEQIKQIVVTVGQAIATFLSACWEGIKSVASAVWNGIKSVITTVITAIQTFITTAWNTIKTVITTILNGIRTVVTTVWNAIKSVITTILNGIKTVVTTIWNGIRSVITTVVTAIRTFITTAWNAIKTVITTVLNGIKTVVTTVWIAIKGVITTVVNAVKNVITKGFNAAKNAVTTAVGAIKSGAVNAFNTMLSGIRKVCGNIFGAVKGGFDKAIGFIKGLASKAYNWGRDFIMGIVNGIKSAIGKVGEAVGEVASKIKSVLHFSTPDEGPLTDYESWMPDFISGLAKGIEKSRGMIQAAMNDVAGDMAVSPEMHFAGVSAGGEGVVSTDLAGSIGSAIRDAIGSSDQSQGDIVIPVYIGTQMLDEIVVSAQERMNLRSGGR